MDKFKKLQEMYKSIKDEDLFIANAYNKRIALGYRVMDLYKDINLILGTNYSESTLRCRAGFINKGIMYGKTNKRYDKTIMFINDVHTPYERKDLLQIISDHADEITTLVIGGDFMDCKSISKFPKIEDFTLKDELIYAYNLLKTIRKILNKNQKIILINGNHEERLRTQICLMNEKSLQEFINPNILEMLAEGFTLYKDNKKTRYEAIPNITVIPHWYVNIDNKIIVSHPKDFSQVDGKMCEKTAEHFLNRHEKFEVLLFGHTHKYSQMKVSRRQGIYVIENGCMCLPQDYADNGKLNYNPQDYCYTIIKYNNNESIDLDNIKVYQLSSQYELDKQENYSIAL